LSWNEGIAKLETFSSDCVVVTGYFDPMLAVHAARLKELAAAGRPLIAVIVEPERPLLPADARACLVAGLAVVDHVMVAPAGGTFELPNGMRVFREEAADLERRAGLMRHVHARQAE
jgi:hypothetical protein